MSDVAEGLFIWVALVAYVLGLVSWRFEQILTRVLST
jgi:hypothetical protein